MRNTIVTEQLSKWCKNWPCVGELYKLHCGVRKNPYIQMSVHKVELLKGKHEEFHENLKI